MTKARYDREFKVPAVQRILNGETTIKLLAEKYLETY